MSDERMKEVNSVIFEREEKGSKLPSKLQISEVFSKIDRNGLDKLVKESNPDPIKVRTPGQLNGTIRRVFNGQVTVVKRVGVTNITKSQAPSKVGEALKVQMARLQSSFNRQNVRYQIGQTIFDTRTPVRISDGTKIHQISKPAAAQSAKFQPKLLLNDSADPKDAYIKRLLEQNLEMKTMLLECRKDASMVQAKMRRMTLVINEVLKKVQNVPHQVPHPSISPEQKKVLPTATVQKEGSTKSPWQTSYRLPTFPIKSINTLKQFEFDLKSREFFEFVFRKVLALVSITTFEKPALLLEHILFVLISSDLLSFFVWDITKQKPMQSASSELFSLKGFGKLNAFFLRLANVKSSVIFGRSMAANAVEQFLASKVTALRKAREMKKEQVVAKKQLKTVMSEINMNRPIRREGGTDEDSFGENNSGESDNDNETEKMIEWLGDESAASEMNAMMNGSRRKSEDNSPQRYEMEEDQDKTNGEAIVDDQFELLGC